MCEKNPPNETVEKTSCELSLGASSSLPISYVNPGFTPFSTFFDSINRPRYRWLEGRDSLPKRTKPKTTKKAILMVRIQPSACTPYWAAFDIINLLSYLFEMSFALRRAFTSLKIFALRESRPPSVPTS